MKHPRKSGAKSRQERRAERRKSSPRRTLIIVRDQSSTKVRRFGYTHAGSAYVVTWRDGRIERIAWATRETAAQYKRLPGALVERVRRLIENN